MKSIYHVKISSVEDLRSEFVTWLEDQARRYENDEALVKTLRDKSIASGRRVAFRQAADFWRDIIIDKEEGV